MECDMCGVDITDNGYPVLRHTVCANCADSVKHLIETIGYERMGGREPRGQSYVIVNTTRLIPWFSTVRPAYPVMPGDDPHTYPDLMSAAEMLVDLHYEHGHTPDTAQIYFLVPVPARVVDQFYQDAPCPFCDKVGFQHADGCPNKEE
jgi:hypothetical protein